MQRVLGIGGLFFRAKDPEALARWYVDNLGVDPVPSDYNTPAWRQEAGETVFAPFKADTDYFDRPEQQWMVNFRVGDLNAMVKQLRANGIEVDFTAGYGEAATDVPDLLKRAVLMLVSHWFELRASFGADQQPVSMPDGYSRLLSSFMSRRLD